MADPKRSDKASATRAEERAQQTNEGREKVFEDLFQHVGHYLALEAVTSYPFRGRDSPPDDTDTWLSIFIKQMTYIGRDELENAQKTYLQHPDSEKGPYQQGTGCDLACEQMTSKVIKLTIQACCAESDLKDGVTYDMLEEALCPVWYEIKGNLKAEILGKDSFGATGVESGDQIVSDDPFWYETEGDPEAEILEEDFSGARGVESGDELVSDDPKGPKQPGNLPEPSQKEDEPVHLCGSPLEIMERILAGRGDALREMSQKAPESSARNSPRPQLGIEHPAAGGVDTLPEQSEKANESGAPPHPIIQALAGAQGSGQVYGSPEDSRAREGPRDDNQGARTPIEVPNTGQNSSEKRSVQKIQQFCEDAFKHKGPYSAWGADNCGKFSDDSKPSEQDAWYTTFKKGMRLNTWSVILTAHKDPEEPDPYEKGINAKIRNQRLADKAINRTLADFHAEDDLKHRERSRERLRDDLQLMYTQYKSDYKPKILGSKHETRGKKRTREADIDNDQSSDRRSDHPSRRGKQAREKRVGAIMRADATDTQSPYELAPFNNPRAPRPVQRTEDLSRTPRHIIDDFQRTREDYNDNNDHYDHDDQRRRIGLGHPPGRTKRSREEQAGAYVRGNGTDLPSLYESAQHNEPRAIPDDPTRIRPSLEYRLPLRLSPELQRRGLPNVRIYLHAWQAGERVYIAEHEVLDRNASVGELWLASQVLEGKAYEQVLSSRGPRQVPMRLFPDLTDLDRLRVLCLDINQDCLNQFLTSQRMLQQWLDRARRTAGASDDGFGEMDLLLCDLSSLQEVHAHYGL